ncbi:Proprotein convertase subtilisin/kexin type 7 [Nowakowskiella sp. JEL0407]|nr:Proprotein convertase subtilisin/kexin type 7 [Nowakowskiella sp. JEL0407]
MDDEVINWFDAQVPNKREKRGINNDVSWIADPLFPDQWHLNNDGINGLVPGNDINVVPVWNQRVNGTGVVVSIIDDGVDFTHPDIKENWSPEGSYDFNERNNNPMPSDKLDVHGTRCAGEIVAARNNVCGVGVAFGAKISGEKVIANTTTDAIEAQAFNYKLHHNHIYSSSWGPSDDGKSLEGPGYLAQQALQLGAQKGRNGLGSIFVFASGNGGGEWDNCNFDGYANSIYTIAIGAIDPLGKLPSYAEMCSAHLAVTFSGGAGLAITTTDLDGQCTNEHSGTSAAAPIASGIIALVLSIRNDLGWRDIQHLIIKSTVVNDPSDGDWKKNGVGLSVSHKYGFGSIDANKMVEEAKSHRLVPRPALNFKKTIYSNVQIPLSQKDAHHVNVGGEIKKEGLHESVLIEREDVNGIRYLEHVQVTVRIKHPTRKFLQIILVSPAGTESILATPRHRDDSFEGFNPWTFMTVHSWGETPEGSWGLIITDTREGDADPYSGQPYYQGELLSWELTLHGTCGLDNNGSCFNSNLSGKFSQSKHSSFLLILFVLIGILLVFALLYRRLFRSTRARVFAFTNQVADIESPTKEPLERRNTIINLHQVVEYIRSLIPRRAKIKKEVPTLKKSWSTDMLLSERGQIQKSHRNDSVGLDGKISLENLTSSGKKMHHEKHENREGAKSLAKQGLSRSKSLQGLMNMEYGISDGQETIKRRGDEGGQTKNLKNSHSKVSLQYRTTSLNE